MSECCPDTPDCSGCENERLDDRTGPDSACPIAYRYHPSAFRRPAEIRTETLYAVGGLYGNRFALDQIEGLAMLEARSRATPTLVFNGDFHWLDIDPPVFNEINRRVLHHVALRGNVETELAGEGDNGCGCHYPAYVDRQEAARSDEIMAILRATSLRFPMARTLLGSLPMHAVAQVGSARVGIVHGDAGSLAGWHFDERQLRDPVNQSGLQIAFREAGVDVFASSHTCLPVLHRLNVDGMARAVINNGAAGMPNFRGARHGVITRISTTPSPSDLPVLYEVSWTVDDHPLHVAAVAVFYDHRRWLDQFRKDWPDDSPAYRSYWDRLNNGPSYRIDEAYPAGGSHA